jgi:rSAM/selenodomain-associated transferase 2/rSAM/selenodomain-associated transferase 1
MTSIVIPAWRGDRGHLERVLADLRGAADTEIVVAAPTDEAGTYQWLQKEHPKVRVVFAPRGRASQMNAGAAVTHGGWLLFLHADSRLPDQWHTAIREAAKLPRVVGGSYRLMLDSDDWRARLIEAGVRARVGLLGLPYGDQALFIRRDVFDAIGGYRDLPLMEDVDLARRLKRVGKLLHHELRVRTSARAWERDGWLTRSAQNMCLAGLFVCGMSPAVLARVYFRRRPLVVGMMARAPWVAGKTRLARDLTPAYHRALRTAIFRDTLEVIRSMEDADRYVLCEPPEACPQLRDLVGPEIEVLAQRDGDLGQRLIGAFEDLFRLGAKHVLLVGSDLPNLPVRFLVAAHKALERRGERVVLGPASDGGYYLIGLRAPHAELFSHVDWGTSHVLSQTLSLARQHGIEADMLEPWYDVDEWDDLERLHAEVNCAAPSTRAWLDSFHTTMASSSGRSQRGGSGGGTGGAQDSFGSRSDKWTDRASRYDTPGVD